MLEQGKHYGSVLVHCNKGVSRSASFVIGYLMKTGGLRLDAALELLKSKRSIVQPNDSFMTQVMFFTISLSACQTERAPCY
jgi:protein-tyrosine phosphatase